MAANPFSLKTASAVPTTSLAEIAKIVRAPAETPAERKQRLLIEDREHRYKLNRHMVLSVGAGVMVGLMYLLCLGVQIGAIAQWITPTAEQLSTTLTLLATITSAAVAFAVGSWSVIRPDDK